MERNQLDLVQLRHPDATPRRLGGRGFVMMPNGLLSVAARLKAAGVRATVWDENLGTAHPKTDRIGLHLDGPPAIPLAIDFIHRRAVSRARVVLGGQVVGGLSEDQFESIFGEQVIAGRGNDIAVLAEGLSGVAKIPSVDEISLVSAYEDLPLAVMREYLQHEIPLHVSSGCKFACANCAAERTQVAPDGTVTTMRERYRNLGCIEKDLAWLMSRLEQLGIDGPLRIFMSNLDVFQTPQKLAEFIELIEGLERCHPHRIKIRGLSTLHSFDAFARDNPELLQRFVSAGFEGVGFGVDGIGKEVWRAMRKGINNAQLVEQALGAAQRFGVTPEILMLIGQRGMLSKAELEVAYQYLEQLHDRYGAESSTYMATPCVPGNDGWRSESMTEIVETLIHHPWTFQALGYSVEANPLKGHEPGPETETLNRGFKAMCDLPGSHTRVLRAVPPGISHIRRRLVRVSNMGKFER